MKVLIKDIVESEMILIDIMILLSTINVFYAFVEKKESNLQSNIGMRDALDRQINRSS